MTTQRGTRQRKRMILIHPPVSKPCEPPAGVAQLAGSLQKHGVRCRVVDGNFEGMLSILNNPTAAPDRWTRRAIRHLTTHMMALRDDQTYSARDRYTRAVMDINRIVTVAGRQRGVSLSLANYQDPALSPVRSGDLIRAAETPETNPFYPYFSTRLQTLIEEDTAPDHRLFPYVPQPGTVHVRHDRLREIHRP